MCLSNFKEVKFRSKIHLAFIRTLPCLICFLTPSQAAHIRKYTDGGTAQKPSDKYAVPLCHRHHHEQHQIGEVAFWGGEERLRKVITFACGLVGQVPAVARAQILAKQWRK